MRSAVLASWLGEVPPEDAVEVLAFVLRESHAGPPMYQVALAALVALRGDDARLPYALERELYLEARRRTVELAHLFLSLQVHPGEASARRPLQNPDGRPLTLGERKQLARAGRRDLVLKLLQDPNGEVVGRALSNPHLTEADIVRLTARRPTEPEVQQAIFSCNRWSCRPTIRRALVLNPYTPRELAVRVVTLLGAADLERVIEDPSIDQIVRETAANIRRGATKGARATDSESEPS